MSIKTKNLKNNESKVIANLPRRRPDWINISAPSGDKYNKLIRLMRSNQLHTVCEEAQCPNIAECWGSGTATFMMMGKTILKVEF